MSIYPALCHDTLGGPIAHSALRVGIRNYYHYILTPSGMCIITLLSPKFGCLYPRALYGRIPDQRGAGGKCELTNARVKLRKLRHSNVESLSLFLDQTDGHLWFCSMSLFCFDASFLVWTGEGNGGDAGRLTIGIQPERAKVAEDADILVPFISDPYNGIYERYTRAVLGWLEGRYARTTRNVFKLRCSAGPYLCRKNGIPAIGANELKQLLNHRDRRVRSTNPETQVPIVSGATTCGSLLGVFQYPTWESSEA